MSDLFTEDSIIMDYGMDYYFVQKLKFKFKKLYGLTEPIHNQMVSKLCNAKFLCSDEKKTTLGCTSLMAWGWVHFQQIFTFGFTIPLAVSKTKSPKAHILNMTVRQINKWIVKCI